MFSDLNYFCQRDLEEPLHNGDLQSQHSVLEPTENNFNVIFMATLIYKKARPFSIKFKPEYNDHPCD